MKYTLLEMVQLILIAMDSDEVNSISDTIESMDVAQTIRSTFYDIATDIGLPEHETLEQLTASGDIAKPCIMTVPATVTRLHNIKYDTRDAGDTYPNYEPVQFLPFEEFLQRQEGYRGDTTNTGQQAVVINSKTYNLLYKSNKHPQWYTTFDDQTLIFDSYDSSIDSTLQGTKTLCMANVYPTFTLDDAFTPDLDPTQFSLLINRAKVRCFKEKKQMDNNEAAGEARRQKIITQKRKRKTPDEPEVYKTARFGRK